MGGGTGGRPVRRPKGLMPDLDVEVHGERPGAHQPFHEVALPVGELGMDGCETGADSWLHRLTTLPPTEGARAAPRSQRGWDNLFLPFGKAVTSSYRTKLHNLDLPQASGTDAAGRFCSDLRQRTLLCQGPCGNQHGPCSQRLTPWGHQDLAVDGTPADGVDIHGSQVAPEVVAGVTLEAFVPEQHSVPWRKETGTGEGRGGERGSEAFPPLQPALGVPLPGPGTPAATGSLLSAGVAAEPCPLLGKQ